jgi:uridine kinase
LFEPLSKVGVARYQARDWEGDTFGESLGEWKDVPVCNFVIFEGIGSSRVELSTYLCVSIWVEAPKKLCIQRGLDRDGADMLELWESCKLMEKEFFRRDQTKSRANYFVDGVTGEIITKMELKGNPLLLIRNSLNWICLPFK